MRNTSDTSLLAAGVVGLALALGTSAAALGGPTVGIALAVMGTMAALAALMPRLLLAPARAAGVKRHTSMICT